MPIVERLSSIAASDWFKRPWSLARRPFVYKDVVVAEYAGVTTRVVLTERKVIVTRPWSERQVAYEDITRVLGGFVFGDRAATEDDALWGLLIEVHSDRALDPSAPREVHIFPMWGRNAHKAANHIYALTRTAPHSSGSQESSTT
jgi:hypothetical protein